MATFAAYAEYLGLELQCSFVKEFCVRHINHLEVQIITLAFSAESSTSYVLKLVVAITVYNRVLGGLIYCVGCFARYIMNKYWSHTVIFWTGKAPVYQVVYQPTLSGASQKI